VRVAVLLLGLAACTDDTDPCAGSSGRCVALRVESAIAVDELELGITIDDTQSVVVRPTDDVSVPFLVPIELGVEPVALDIVAVGRAGQPVVAAGAVTVDMDSTAPVLTLGVPQACIDGGYYCGGDKLYGDASILYICRSNRVPALRERCAGACIVAPSGTDDYCAE
jgi:hypothetical protein